MKNIFTIIIVFLGLNLCAQTPQAIKYQAVARDGGGNVLANKAVSFRISILQTSVSGSAKYSETHSKTTNTFGLVDLEIGNGTPMTGSFTGISWGSDNYFVKVEMDPNGGSAYQVMGTSQLLSVPYALYAKDVQNNNDADADPANELQKISINGTVLTLDKSGGSVTLPSSGGGDNWGTQTVATDATLSGNGTTSTPLKITDNAVNSSKITDGSIAAADIANSAITTDKINAGAVTGTKIAQTGATSGQALKWNGTTWAPAADETGTGNPTGSAGGDLTGTYPNPILGDGKINSSKILDGTIAAADLATNAVTTDKINAGAVTGAKIAQASATSGQALKWNGTSWAPAADETGTGNPTGTAGGDLTGTYPNPTLVDGKVTSAKIADTTIVSADLANNAVTTDKINTGAVTGAKIAQAGATSGQVLKWNGSAWLPSADLSGSDVWQISGSNIYRSTGNVGIGTSLPRALFHTKGTGVGGGDFLAEGLFKDKADVPPISGAGTRMMWYPDKAAFRAGEVAGTNWDKDSIGNHSVAMGYDTKAKGITSLAIGNGSVATADYAVALGGLAKASGIRSVAIGAGTNASNNWSIAIGSYSTSSGMYATALGHLNSAEGIYSMALGANTIAHSASEVVVGSFNSIYTPASKTGWNVDDRLFVIGNGVVDVPHNAMTVLKNGNTGIGIDIPTALLHVNGTGTGEGNVLFSGNYKSSGQGNPPASGSGTRMMWYPDKAAFRAGTVSGNHWDKDSIGLNSVSMGYNSKAVGPHAVAFGRESKARGERSISLGDYAYAVGNGSVALGPDSRANGVFSVSLGNSNADSYYSTTAGVNNVGGGSKTSWVATDPLFEIGNSQSSSSPKNALTILKNANIGIGAGATIPEYLLSIGANDVGFHVPSTNTLSLHTDGAERMRISGSGNVGIGTVSPAVKLHLQNSSGDLRLRMQSNDGNELQFHDNSGNFEASVGFSKSQGHLYLYQGGTVAIKGGKLGVGTIDPAAKLDVNGTVKIGTSGSLLTGIVLLRGYMSYDKSKDESYILFPYPAGFNRDNTVVLASEYQTLDDNWIGSDYHSCRNDGVFVTQHTNILGNVKVVIMCFQ